MQNELTYWWSLAARDISGEVLVVIVLLWMAMVESKLRNLLI